MCGILSWYSKTGDIDENLFKKSLLLQHHRGPDYSKILRISEKNIFGHNRLSIIDLESKANQPMVTNNSVLVFNGEIYNYKEIREELKNRNVFCDTLSDTEVLLKALDIWGTNILTKLNGMWAISYFKKDENKIILSRDRFGKKPLYYYIDNNDLIVSSEIKSAAALMIVSWMSAVFMTS